MTLGSEWGTGAALVADTSRQVLALWVVQACQALWRSEFLVGDQWTPLATSPFVGGLLERGDPLGFLLLRNVAAHLAGPHELVHVM